MPDSGSRASSRERSSLSCHRRRAAPRSGWFALDSAGGERGFLSFPPFPPSPGCPSTIRQALAEGALPARASPPDHRGASSAGCRAFSHRRAGQRTRRTLRNWFAISENTLSRFSLVGLARAGGERSPEREPAPTWPDEPPAHTKPELRHRRVARVEDAESVFVRIPARSRPRGGDGTCCSSCLGTRLAARVLRLAARGSRLAFRSVARFASSAGCRLRRRHLPAGSPRVRAPRRGRVASGCRCAPCGFRRRRA